MKTSIRTLAGLCAVLVLFSPAPVFAGEAAAADIDAQIAALKSQAQMLTNLRNTYRAGRKINSHYRKAYKMANAQLNAVQAQLSKLQAQKAATGKNEATQETIVTVPDISAELGSTLPVQPSIPEIGIEKIAIGDDPPEYEINPPKISISDILDEYLAEHQNDDDPVDEEGGDDVDDDDEEGDDDDDDDEEDEPETDPHRKWLEEFVDGKLEGVPNELWSKTLYEAYFEAYGILKADSTCPPDLLVEVAGLCEQFKPAYEATLEALENAEEDDNPPAEQEGTVSTDDGKNDEDEEDEDENEGEEDDDEVDGETDGEEGDEGGSSGGGTEDGASEPEEEGEEPEEEPEEEEWNGPYVDDEIPDFGGGSSSGSSGDPEKKTAAGGEEPAARPLVNPASGGSSGGRVPSSTGQLYGRAPTSESSGAGFVSAGNYFGAGTTADASVATNYVDEIPYELLQWKFGGFHPPTNAVRSSVTVADLRASRGGMEMKWIRDLGAWGIPYEVPDALACLFVKNEEGEWVGGKFEWISSSRKTRGFENIRSGYGGWNLRGVPNPCEVAFLVFRKDGRRRSNIVVGLWER